MKHLALPCLLALLAVGAAPAQDETQADLDQLTEISQSFVDAFNERDAEAIAKLFVSDGELVLAAGDLVIGQDDLLAHYNEVFAGDDIPQAALEAGSVRFVTPGIATEDGTVHLTYDSGEVASHFYTAVLVEQEDGTWLYASVRDQEGDHARPDEKLFALQWIVGDWVIQGQEADTWLSFDWSESGPYIDAKMVTQAAGIRSTAATFRIGWNERSETFNSWAFDDEGGFAHSSWIAEGRDGWILKTNGITADGEVHNATQTISLDESGQSFSWTKRDRVIGGVLYPDLSVRAVKQPPLPGIGEAESE